MFLYTYYPYNLQTTSLFFYKQIISIVIHPYNSFLQKPTYVELFIN